MDYTNIHVAVLAMAQQKVTTKLGKNQNLHNLEAIVWATPSDWPKNIFSLFSYKPAL